MPTLGARTDPGARAVAIDRNLRKPGHIDRQHIIAQVQSRPAVAARSHGDRKTSLARELHGRDHILRVFGRHDGGGKSGREVGAPEDFLLENSPSIPIIPAVGSFP